VCVCVCRRSFPAVRVRVGVLQTLSQCVCVCVEKEYQGSTIDLMALSQNTARFLLYSILREYVRARALSPLSLSLTRARACAQQRTGVYPCINTLHTYYFKRFKLNFLKVLQI